MHETRNSKWMPLAAVGIATLSFTMAAALSWSPKPLLGQHLAHINETILIEESAEDRIPELSSATNSSPESTNQRGKNQDVRESQLSAIQTDGRLEGAERGPATQETNQAKLFGPVADRVNSQIPISPRVDPPTKRMPPLKPTQPRSRSDRERPQDQRGMPRTPTRKIDRLLADKPRWPIAHSLLEQLQGLKTIPETHQWAQEIETTLDLLQLFELQQEHVYIPETIEQLRSLAFESQSLASQIALLESRIELLHVGYATERRAEIWKNVQSILKPHSIAISLRDSSGRGIEVLQQLFHRLSSHPQRSTWIQYLRLADIELAIRGDHFTTQESRSLLARTILRRLHTDQLNVSQQKYLQHPAFVDLESMLRTWVTEPIQYTKLLHNIEKYELHRGSAEASQIARAFQIARWSQTESVQKLAYDLDRYYRNANIRVAISAELINHMLPEPGTIDESVNDNLDGTHVTGRSRASSRLGVFLVPDRRQWRLGLETQGVINSETEASQGPARFYHDSSASYRAHKVFGVNQRGLQFSEAIADAETSSTLTGLATNFDRVPVLNMIARAAAVSQHDRKQETAKREIRRRLTERVEHRLDSETEASLQEIRDAFLQRFHTPMRKLQLNPTPMDLETTESRILARYRLAADDQLASHTPRPLAPGDSLFSCQIHESAINNILSQLCLDGRQVELKTLYRELGQIFQGVTPQLPDDIPDGVQLTFAEADAVKVRFENNQIEIKLALADLSHNKQSWGHFVVRATYQPLAQTLDATFERVDYIHLKGRRLKVRDQVVLRGIFSSVFKRRPPVHLLGDDIAQDERFTKLQLSQHLVHDGWIGVALSPEERGVMPSILARGEIPLEPQ